MCSGRHGSPSPLRNGIAFPSIRVREAYPEGPAAGSCPKLAEHQRIGTVQPALAESLKSSLRSALRNTKLGLRIAARNCFPHHAAGSGAPLASCSKPSAERQPSAKKSHARPQPTSPRPGGKKRELSVPVSARFPIRSRRHALRAHRKLAFCAQNAVPVMGDFSGDPVAGETRISHPHQLRLPMLRVCPPTTIHRQRASVSFHLPPSFSSIPLMRRNSGSRPIPCE